MSRNPNTMPQETRVRLLQAATEEFAATGYRGTSLRDICAAAGVTTGALYFFFNNKEDLFSSVVHPVTSRVFEYLQLRCSESAEISLYQAVRHEREQFRTFAGLLHIYYRNQMVCNIILNNRTHPIIEEFFDEIVALLDRHMVWQLQEAGQSLSDGTAFSGYTVHWSSHLQIDAFLNLVSHGFDEAKAIRQARLIVRYMRGGISALMETSAIRQG